MPNHPPASKVETVWNRIPVHERCRRVASVASLLAERGELLSSLCRRDWREDDLTTVSGELLPLCSALKWIGTRGPSVLGVRHLGVWGRPAWLWGVCNEVHRRPRGTVLIIGAWNYPLLLVGAQIGQALAAGNFVKFKPAEGCEEIAEALVEAFYDAGVPRDCLELLGAEPREAMMAIDQGVDLIVLTGSAATGRVVLRQAAEKLTPVILELSGCDAVVACPSADFQRVAACIAFGLTFNSGATCIGPRRLIADQSGVESILESLIPQLAKIRPLAIHPAARKSVGELIQKAFDEGAKDLTGRFSGDEFEQTGRMPPLVLGGVSAQSQIANADVFAPVISVIQVDKIRDAVSIVNECRYRLAASVFGNSLEASSIADQLLVGSVTINDLIVPTADPRVPFGGRGESGFGVTRGEEGLLEMTVPTLKSIRKSKVVAHLIFNREEDAKTLLATNKMLHASSFASKIKGLFAVMQSVKRTR